MDCSRIPPAVLWDQATPQQLQQYQAHVRTCRKCRLVILCESPHLLLQELASYEMPDAFWLGFWDSLRKKISVPGKRPDFAFRVARWAAVFIFLLMMGYSERMSESPVIPEFETAAFDEEYPIVEEIGNNPVTYYVFQGAGGEKVVLLFDSEIEL